MLLSINDVYKMLYLFFRRTERDRCVDLVLELASPSGGSVKGLFSLLSRLLGETDQAYITMAFV